MESDNFNEVVAQVGDNLQFCKRVKYLEKAWLLLTAEQKYYWVNQDDVPLDSLKALDVLKDAVEKEEYL